MASSFRRDPLGFFDQQLQTGAEVFWLMRSMLCVAEPAAAKAVLANPDGLFEEHSDFFHTTRGPFGPRELQASLGRSARKLLTERVAARDDALDESLDRSLGRSSTWPNAGNQFVFRHLRDTLLTPERWDAVGPLLEGIVERSVYAGAREQRSWLSRFFFRRRAFAALTREVEHRRSEVSKGELSEPRDLFDVLAICSDPEGQHGGVRSSDLGQLYLPFFFAVVSSVGFTLAWAAYLLGRHPDDEAESADVVREALRLWPIAWQTGRRPVEAHEIAGVEVTPKHHVVVSAYVTHRHPAYWDEPEQFRPERWAGRKDHAAYFPFGWGPHTCAAASLSLQLATAALARLRRRFRLHVHPESDRPYTGPSLAPPRFRLDLDPLNS